MSEAIHIQDIEALRRREGIDDVELREGIKTLGVGDFVRLTLLTRDSSFAGETLVVQITGISGPSFRGRLAGPPTSKGLAGMQIGSPLAFTATHIHSLPKGGPTGGH
jgi:hypothetical protein